MAAMPLHANHQIIYCLNERCHALGKNCPRYAWETKFHQNDGTAEMYLLFID